MVLETVHYGNLNKYAMKSAAITNKKKVNNENIKLKTSFDSLKIGTK
jgi:hypothetical protein